jgi:hypothetical protein
MSYAVPTSDSYSSGVQTLVDACAVMADLAFPAEPNPRVASDDAHASAHSANYDFSRSRIMSPGSAKYDLR